MHEMRRRDRALSEAEARETMARADFGTLATVGADGWPYAVVVNHVLDGDQLYFHSGNAGHKLENIAFDERVSFSAVAQARILPEQVTTRYESAVLFGRATRVEEPAEKHRALELLGRRFCPEAMAAVAAEIHKDGPRTVVVRIAIERLTGKASR
jgi:hypothetical protein